MSTKNTDPDRSRAVPTAPSTLQRWFPIGAWLPKYKWGKFVGADLVAAMSCRRRLGLIDRSADTVVSARAQAWYTFGPNPADAWAAIYTPEGWTEDHMQRLRDVIGHGK